MAWLADKEFWVALIGYASIASVAVFGLFGAYAKTRGKPGTAAEARSTGRLELVSILGIIFSAVFAMSSAILRSWIDDEKGEQQAASTALDDAVQRFRSYKQLETLYRMNVRMIQANVDSRETLLKQDGLLSSAQRSMLMTAGLTAQEQENTGRVLHGMWDDANRIGTSSLVAVVNYACGTVHGDFPRLMDEGARMTVRVARPTDRQRFASRLRSAFHTRLFLRGDHPMSANIPDPLPRDSARFPRDSATFESLEQHITVIRPPTGEGDQVDQVARFTSFQSRNLGPFSEAANWRGAVVEAVIVTFQPGLVARAAAALGESPGGRVEVGGEYDISQVPAGDAYSMSMLSCPVYMTLVVNGRHVARAEGRLVQVRERRDDGRGLVVVKFPIVDVDAAAFPAFGIASPHRRAAR